MTIGFAGYYAVGASVTLVAISPSGIVDLCTANLEDRVERVQNIVKIIKLCPIIRLLSDMIPPQNEFLPMRRRVHSILFPFKRTS
jgi:hypothetical protein